MQTFLWWSLLSQLPEQFPYWERIQNADVGTDVLASKKVKVVAKSSVKAVAATIENINLDEEIVTTAVVGFCLRVLVNSIPILISTTTWLTMMYLLNIYSGTVRFTV